MLNSLHVIAQATQPNQPAGSPLSNMLMMIIPLGLIIYFLMIRPQSKDRKRREAMLAAMKKGDRVVTIGGVLGTVTNVKDDEVTLKVDESTNTKITFTRSAIQRIVASETPSQ